MRTFKSNHVINYKSGRKLGDLSVLYGLKNSPIFHMLIFKFKEGLWMILRQFLEANAVIISYCYSGIFRYRHGQLVCGLLMTILSASFIVAFNSIHLWTWVSPFVTFGVPVFALFKSQEALFDLAFVDVHSDLLLIYLIAFTGFSLFNVIACWLGHGHENATQRGVSYLYILLDYFLGGYVQVGLFFIHFVEALAMIVLGVYLWHSGIDAHFGWFLITISAQEAFMLLNEKSRSVNSRAFLSA